MWGKKKKKTDSGYVASRWYPIGSMFYQHCLFDLSQYRHLYCRVIPAIWCVMFFSTMLHNFQSSTVISCFCFGNFSSFSWHSVKKKSKNLNFKGLTNQSYISAVRCAVVEGYRLIFTTWGSLNMR